MKAHILIHGFPRRPWRLVALPRLCFVAFTFSRDFALRLSYEFGGWVVAVVLF
jgi:hypothetical protein